MVIVSRTLNDILKFDGAFTESIIGVFTTWGSKLNNILLAITTGITTSLLPHIVSSYTVGNKKVVDDTFNKTIKCILFIIVPMTLFLSILSNNVWTLFYGSNTYGAEVYKVFVFYAIFGGTYSIIVNTLQGINKYKLVISGVVIGLIFNLIFDIPFILLFNKLGLNPSWGAVVCGCIGYTISILMSVIVLSRKYDFKFTDTIKKIPSYLYSWIAFVLVILGLKIIIPLDVTGRLIQIPVIAIYGIVSFGVYALINYFNGNIKELFDLKRGRKK